MSGVSCKACRWILDWLESQSLDAAELLASNPALPQQSVLRDSSHQITWPEFLALCSALGDLCAPILASGDEPVLTRVGRDLGHQLFRSAVWRRHVLGSTPVALYTAHAAPALAFLFSSLSMQAEAQRDGTLQVEITLPRDAGNATPFFELCAGLARSAPELLELPACHVASEIQESRARYRIGALRTFPLRPLQPLRTAWNGTEARIAEVSLDVLGRRLAEAVSREAAAALLFDLLREHFGCRAARLWLVHGPDDASKGGALSLLRTEGETDKPPSRSLPLALGERAIGRLDLWDPDPVPQELPEVLEGLLPWFTLVLDAAARSEDRASTALPSGEIGRFTDLVHNAADVLCELGGDGRITYVSPAVAPLLGHGPDHFEGKSFIEFIAEQDRARHLGDFANLQASGRAERVVFRTLHADGRPRWLEASVRPFHTSQGHYRVCCVIRDVDRRRDAEAALFARDQRHHALLENFDEIAVVLDDSGRILLRSGNAASYLGVPDSPTLLDDLIARVHPEDRQVLSRAWHSPSGDGPVKRAEFRLLDTAGTGHRWLRGTWKPLETASGEKAHSLVLRDITDRRQSERSLRAIAAGISTEHGHFFPSLVRHLAEALGSDIAHIALVDPETPGPGRSLALWKNGQLVPDESWTLASAPCCEVLKGDLCCYPTGVSQLFGDDADLTTLEIDSYVGIPLELSDGSIVGHLCCLGRRPLPDPDHARSMIRIFGQRAAAELQREQAALALRRSEERYRTLAENARDIIVEVTSAPDPLYISPSAEEVLGYPLDELASGSHLDRIHPEDVDRVSSSFRTMLETERGDQLVFRVKHQNGEWCWLETNARTYHAADGRLHIVATLRDITQRALAEQQREQLISIIQNSSDLIALASLDGSMIFLNAAGREMVGLESEEEAASKTLYDLLPPEEARKMERRIMPSVHRNRHWSDELVLRHLESGEPIATLANVFLVYNRDGAPAAVAAICRDIGDRKQAEQALLESEEKLRQAQKMEAIGRLAGGIAHDFNNLLTAITGYCDLLLEALDPDDDARSDAHEILKASDRASALTNQLLAFSRRQVLQPKIIELNALVSDIDRMLRRLIGEHIELVSILEGELWTVKADPGQLQQVILNLVVNARDAMPRGGRIVIETANVEIAPHDDRVSHDMLPGPYVSLSVRDSGEGMSKETRARIFEPFFTTKPSGKGTGLGLSTVFGIVRQSGGHLGVESTLGEGSTFRLYLPKANEVETPAECHTSQPQFRGSETVLLVEDAAPVRQLVHRYLRRHGYQVLEAASGIEALRYGHRHQGPIHLLLTDVVLPRMDGTQIAERIQALRPETRVLYMSGFSDESLVRYGISGDSIVLLEKPFTPTSLLQMVRAQLDREAPPRTPADETPGES